MTARKSGAALLDDDALVETLGHIPIHPAEHLTKMRNLGGFVLENVDIKTIVAAVRAEFESEPDRGLFVEAFAAPFAVPNKNGEGKFDVIFGFRTRGGSSDKARHSLISDWVDNNETFVKFGKSLFLFHKKKSVI